MTIRPTAQKLVHPQAQVYHYTPQVLACGFSPGVGIMPRDPPQNYYRGPKVRLTVQFPFPDVTAQASLTVDEGAKRVTVVVDGRAETAAQRGPSKPIELELVMERPAEIGATYELLVQDFHGKLLARQNLLNVIPI